MQALIVSSPLLKRGEQLSHNTGLYQGCKKFEEALHMLKALQICLVHPPLSRSVDDEGTNGESTNSATYEESPPIFLLLSGFGYSICVELD